ncbi:MAG: oligosaccharide flippase family protein, partial [Acidobacteria bacterium]|nr:oligosaccharide flippase family protein [Acidobacteriota bacterium]
AVAVVLALLTRNVWALVASQLMSVAASVVLSYLFDSYRPRLAFDRDVLRQSLNFGKHVFVIGVAAYVTTTADNVVAGRLLGAAALGVYVVAYNLASIPIGMIGSVLSAVLLPAYVELQTRDRERLARTFLRAFAASCVLLTAASILLALLADEIILVLYGTKWLGAASILRVLALICFSRGLMLVITPLLLITRGPALEARAKIVEAMAFLLLLYPLMRSFGLAGAAWAGAVIYLFTLLSRLWLVRSIAPRAAATALRILLASTCAGVPGLLAGMLVVSGLRATTARLIAGGLVSLSAMLLTMSLLHPALRRAMREMQSWLRAGFIIRQSRGG